jgi:hypothetical protein
MPVQTEHRFPLDLSVPDAGGGRVLHAHRHLPGLHPTTPAPWPGWTYPPHGVQPVVVVPGPPTHAARVRRILGDRVTVVSSDGAQAHLAAGLHRTLLLQHSGIMLIDAAGVVRYRLATALPTGSFDGPTLQAAIDRP